MAAARPKLARYRAKRKFDITAEPSGGKPTRGGDSFVVQKHAARRLHYDFRLELDGVLVSWAVPKGPSLDPADKRLAAHVEDHPIDYGGFEGTIPQGQYGGGTVMLWDRGTWEPQDGEDAREGYRKGRLKFILHGERMKGGWTLVRMGPRGQERNSDNWLLIKERDAEARPGQGTWLVDKGMKSVASGRTMEEIADAPDRNVWQSNRRDRDDEPPPKRAPAKPTKKTAAATPRAAGSKGVKKARLPDFVPPTLTTLVDRPPGGDQWLHEIKIDGYRIFARRRNGKVALLTRTGLDWTGRFKPIADAVAKLPGGDLALDGEVAVLDQNGGSSFASLQDALSRGDAKPLRYIVFDLLYRDGEDWRGAKLTDRKETLRALLDGSGGPLVYSDHVVAHGGEVYQHACNLALEGVVSKRADLSYHEGRTRDWLKSKCVARQEFVIVGFTDSTVHRGIGALALGYYEDETLRYAGRVGTGFDHRTAMDLAKRLKPLITDRMPFQNLPSAARRGVHWTRPELVCEIAFLNWTPDGVLRHPSFQGLREDKPAKSVTRERATPAGKAAKDSGKDDPPPPAAEKTTARKGPEKIAGVSISHPDRVIFPDLGITKRQLVEYYAAVADWILPHIANRPLSLLRCPSGIDESCFFQKHFTGMKSIRRVTIKEKSGPGEYLVLRDVKDLVLLIQEGIVEIHPWGATADDPDSPDQFIFDFDPAPKLSFAAVIDAAKAMRDYLAAMKIESFVKTTGGKGLHVVAPLKRGIDWAEIKAFTKKIAANFATAAPDRFTINPLKRERTNRIFVDYLRNDRGSTAVAPYVVRARPGATIALPIEWNDVNARLDPSRYTIASVPKLLASRKSDPWAGMTKHRQTISSAQRALGLAA